MTNETLYGTVEEVSRNTAVIITDTNEDLYQCRQFATTPALNYGDIVRFTLTPKNDISDIVIDYSEMQRRYANA